MYLGDHRSIWDAITLMWQNRYLVEPYLLRFVVTSPGLANHLLRVSMDSLEYSLTAVAVTSFIQTICEKYPTPPGIRNLKNLIM